LPVQRRDRSGGPYFVQHLWAARSVSTAELQATAGYDSQACARGTTSCSCMVIAFTWYQLLFRLRSAKRSALPDALYSCQARPTSVPCTRRFSSAHGRRFQHQDAPDRARMRAAALCSRPQRCVEHTVELEVQFCAWPGFWEAPSMQHKHAAHAMQHDRGGLERCQVDTVVLRTHSMFHGTCEMRMEASAGGWVGCRLQALRHALGRAGSHSTQQAQRTASTAILASTEHSPRPIAASVDKADRLASSQQA